MDSYRQAVTILPEPLRAAALGVEAAYMARVEEVRLRIGRIPALVLPEGEKDIPGTSAVTSENLARLVEIASRWSLHTVLEQLRRGYLTVEGGHRLGLCGTVVMEGEQIQNLRNISSADLRVARQLRGTARPVAGQLWQDGQLQNTLILAPPGAGKTTLLRDLIRCISDGEAGSKRRVAVADERGELAAIWRGQPQMELGSCTDVLDGCPKAQAIPLLLRGMGPQVIAVDEITVNEDIRAMEQAVGCGTALLATAHGSGPEDLRRRPLYREVMDKGIFHKIITIQVEQGRRKLRVMSMEELI
ncbi:MAG: stage III sporulation protein AB [Ruminococcaceae bacterium]|nr:stage III sporulation protein AB [Oscillospiraceae bacterium]